jgi:hypothetical protein
LREALKEIDAGDGAGEAVEAGGVGADSDLHGGKT